MTHGRIAFSPVLADLLRLQAGVISTQQACALLSRGTLRGLAGDGVWQPLARGLWLTTPELSWQGRVWAGLLVGGAQAAVSGTAALHLHGLQDAVLPVLIRTPTRTQRSIEGVRFLRGWLGGAGEPSRVSVEDALLDAWREVSSGDFQILLGRALNRRRTDMEAMLACLERRGPLPGRAQLRELLGDVAAGATSPLESRYRRQVERAHALPAAVRQAPLPGGRADGWYPDFGVALELDGRRYHEDIERDRSRDAVNAAHGIVTLRFGWREVTQTPCAVARRVAQVLRIRGWGGQARPCRSCRGEPMESYGS